MIKKKRIAPNFLLWQKVESTKTRKADQVGPKGWAALPHARGKASNAEFVEQHGGENVETLTASKNAHKGQNNLRKC